MAIVKAYFRADSYGTDFNFYSRHFYDDVFHDNIYYSYAGRTYQDLYQVNGWDGIEDLVLSVGGTGISFNQRGDVIGGTVTGLVESTYEGADIVLLQDFAVSAVRMYNVAQTAGNADDRALLSTILACNDTITLSAYDDRFEGWTGHDAMFGAGGNDTLIGGGGNDALTGGMGHDRLLGGVGNDRLTGAMGYDVLEGGLGADSLDGGLGLDRMFAGADAVRDVFIFRAPGESAVGAQRDVLLQFRAGQDDIDLSLMDAGIGRAGNQAFAFAGTTAAANSVWYVPQAGGVLVRGDVNGNRIADFEIWLDGVARLAASDFIL